MVFPSYVQDSPREGGTYYVSVKTNQACFAKDKEEAQSILGVGWAILFEPEFFIPNHALSSESRKKATRRSKYINSVLLNEPTLGFFAFNKPNGAAESTEALQADCCTALLHQVRAHHSKNSRTKYYVYRFIRNYVWLGPAPDMTSSDFSMQIGEKLIAFRNSHYGNSGNIVVKEIKFEELFPLEGEDPNSNLFAKHSLEWDDVAWKDNVVPLSDVYTMSTTELCRKYGSMKFFSVPKRFAPSGSLCDCSMCSMTPEPDDSCFFLGIASDIDFATLPVFDNTSVYIRDGEVIEIPIKEDSKNESDDAKKVLEKRILGLDPNDIYYAPSMRASMSVSVSDTMFVSETLLVYDYGGRTRFALLSCSSSAVYYCCKKLGDVPGVSNVRIYLSDAFNYFMRNKSRLKLSLLGSVTNIGKFLKDELAFLSSIPACKLPCVKHTKAAKDAGGGCINFQSAELAAKIHLYAATIECFDEKLPPDYGLEWDGKTLVSEAQADEPSEQSIRRGRERWFKKRIEDRTVTLILLSLILDDQLPSVQSIIDYYSATGEPCGALDVKYARSVLRNVPPLVTGTYHSVLDGDNGTFIRHCAS